ncbi:MAG: hypothetical protein H6949_14720 [Zoogloeaceae bacterium]|nr:hypothetical protein [Zoogloeaceae bacterium]
MTGFKGAHVAPSDHLLRWTLLGLALVLGLGLALLVGAGVGVGYGLYVGAAVVGAVGLLVWWRVGGWSAYAVGGTGLFWWALALTFLTQFVTTFSPVSVLGVMEVWFLAVAVLAVPMSGKWMRQSAFGRAFMALFIAFCGLSVLSSLFGRSEWWPAVYQFLYNLKFPLMLLLGFRIGWEARARAQFWKVVSWLWVPVAVIVAVQIVVPNIYFSLAVGVNEGGALSTTGNPLLRGVLPRLTGPFVHSGVLAYFSALFLGLLVVRLLTDSVARRSLWSRLAVAGYFGLLLLSGQRQEAAAFVMMAMVLIVIVKFRFSLFALFGAAAMVVLALSLVLIVLGPDQLYELAGQWGVGSPYEAITSARTVFYRDSVYLANTHFPLGSGLGTFGGVGAQKFDHSLYDQLGYGRYWWYLKNVFLVDTYWPNFIAEAGWLGAAAIAACAIGLVLVSLLRAWRAESMEEKQIWGMAFVGQFMLVVVSLTSPLYSDPNLAAIAMMFFGIASRWSSQASKTLTA